MLLVALFADLAHRAASMILRVHLDKMHVDLVREDVGGRVSWVPTAAHANSAVLVATSPSRDRLGAPAACHVLQGTLAEDLGHQAVNSAALGTLQLPWALLCVVCARRDGALSQGPPVPSAPSVVQRARQEPM